MKNWKNVIPKQLMSKRDLLRRVNQIRGGNPSSNLDISRSFSDGSIQNIEIDPIKNNIYLNN